MTELQMTLSEIKFNQNMNILINKLCYNIMLPSFKLKRDIKKLTAS